MSIHSVTKDFPAPGCEGVTNGIVLRNAEIMRRMPWGNNWTMIRIGMLVSIDFNISSIYDSTKLPGPMFHIGVCSGPWGIGDHAGRTFRYAGLSVQGNSSVGGWDFYNNWNRYQIGTTGDYLRYISNISRGCATYVYSTQGSYENGGVPGTREWQTSVGSMGTGGAWGVHESTGVPRRSPIMIDIYRYPYGTQWQMRWHCGQYNTMPDYDTPDATYRFLLNSRVAVNTDLAYGLSTMTATGQWFNTAIYPDTRNAPMDHLDIYWTHVVAGMEIWRLDLLKLQ